MRILLVHNYYQLAGGEGLVFQAESELLKDYGHHVLQYTAHNDQLTPANPLTTARKMLWNQQVYQEILEIVERENIQVVHFHNIFPLISPAAYYAVKSAGAAVVQTLHNYRILCPNALFLRDQKPCEDCLGKLIPWPAVVHKCYRNDRIASGAVATLLTTHRTAKTWSRCVDTYIALTAFAKEKLIQGGIPPHKIAIKPNFVDPDPGFQARTGQHALFVGRLSVEKGIDVLLSAWKLLGSDFPLKIVGDGPLAREVKEAADNHPGIEWLGRLPAEQVYQQMKSARLLVFPSKWYEGMPRTIVESFAVGTPVLASELGAMKSLVQHNQSGWHFQPGSADHLAQVVQQVFSKPATMTTLRASTRKIFENHYSASQNYRQLLDIYHAVVQ